MQRTDTENTLKTNTVDVKNLTTKVRGGDVDKVCLDSLWEWDAHLRWCVREALKPLLLLLTVRARGSAECGGGEEMREGGEWEESYNTARWKGCIGFMQGRLITVLTAKRDLWAFML